MQAVGSARSSVSTGIGNTACPLNASHWAARYTPLVGVPSVAGSKRHCSRTRSARPCCTRRSVGAPGTGCSRGSASAAGLVPGRPAVSLSTAPAVASVTPAQPPGRRKWVLLRPPASNAMSTCSWRGRVSRRAVTRHCRPQSAGGPPGALAGPAGVAAWAVPAAVTSQATAASQPSRPGVRQAARLWGSVQAGRIRQGTGRKALGGVVRATSLADGSCAVDQAALPAPCGQGGRLCFAMIQRLPSALPLGSLLLPVLSLVVLVVFFGGDPG